MAQSGEGIEDGVLDIVSSGMPLRRFTFPDEVSGICVYLASDDSTFMTGSILLIDGGAANVDVAGAALAMAGVNWGVSEKVFFDGWKALSRFFDNRMCAASRTNDRKSVMKMRPLQTDLSGFSRLNLERSPVWIGIISYLGSCEISGDLILL